MEIINHLPKYTHPSDNSNQFYKDTYLKREFNDNKLDIYEPIPKEKGSLMKHQKFISRFLSSKTTNDSLLIVHEMGTGKTCSAIGVIEQIRRENNDYKGAFIFSKGPTLLENFENELINTCTSGEYKPYLDDDDLTNKQKRKLSKSLYREWYHFSYNSHSTTFQTFAKNVLKNIDKSQVARDNIKNIFSNHVLVLDEVHNIRDKDKDKESVDVYKLFKIFLHLVENCKIILLTGTPIKDTPKEIIDVINLILPPKQQINKKNIFETVDDKIKLVDGAEVILKDAFRGKVSFLRSVNSDVEKVYLGKPIRGLKYFKVVNCPMKDIQLEVYKQSVLKDKEEKSIFSNSRQSSCIVFPDKTYAKKGYQNYEINKDRNAGVKLKNEFGKIKTQDERLEFLKKISSKFYYIVNDILNNKNKNSFIYCSYISVIKTLVIILNIFGCKNYKRHKSEENTIKYAVITGKTTVEDRRKILNIYNHSDNKHGKNIRILIGSNVISEGITLKNVQDEYIISPWFNYSQLEQVIARGYRLGSHDDLKDEDIKLTIHQLVATTPPDEKESVDIKMYKESENKDIINRTIIRIMKEMAVDCNLNYKRNYTDKGVDNSRECDYQVCKYKCEFNEDEYKEEEEEYIDNYNILYSKSNRKIHNSLYNLFLKYHQLSLEQILDFLIDEYTPSEIVNSLSRMTDTDNMSFNEYINKYYTTPEEKIILDIRKLFRQDFELSLTYILNKLNKYTFYQIVDHLNIFITQPIEIIDKYGYNKWLKEKDNIYYLTSNNSIDNDEFSSYYSKNLSLSVNIKFKNMLDKLKIDEQDKFKKDILDMTYNNSDKFREQFITLINSISIKSQISVIKDVIADKDKYNRRKYILDYFDNDINYIDDDIYLELEPDNIQVLKNDEWVKMNEEQSKKRIRYLKKFKSKLNKSKYYGKYNSKNKAFSIVVTNEIDNDNRKKTTGKVCTSYKKNELITILKHLNIYNKKENKIVSEICLDIKDELRRKNLIINDDQSGKVGQTKNIVRENKEKKQYTYHITKKLNKTHYRELRTLMNEQFNIPRYRKEPDDIIYFIYKSNTIIGCIIKSPNTDDDGGIKYICISETHADKNVLEEMLDENQTILMILENKTKQFDTYLDLYKRYGMNVYFMNENNTLLYVTKIK